MSRYDKIINTMHVDQLIDLAIAEDIGSGDITTNNLPGKNEAGIGQIIAKEPLVIAGLEIAEKVFSRFEADVHFLSDFRDGSTVKPKDIIAEIRCSIGTLLTGERIALNFLQRLSGIATNVRDYVNELKDSAESQKVRLVDTRKTTPGWRVLEKYAVRMGGGYNHRMGLYDGVLIKDNHIEVFGGIQNAISYIRNKVSHFIKIEVETSTLEEVRQALDAGADIIMLDNMDISQIKESVDLIGDRAIIEVSGRVNKENLKHLANTGVDIISIGALTHSAVSVDISMNIFAAHP
jgi:nicotinate-nucleotide pyrophosphorylase (carboxylating)